MSKFPVVPHQGRRIKEYDISSGEDFSYGAAVRLDASQEITEAGADPADILGFAMFDAGQSIPDSKMSVAVAHETATFLMDGDADPEKSDIDQDFGIAEDSDNVWHVDTSDTTNTVVRVEDVDLERNLFEVSILSGSRQSEA